MSEKRPNILMICSDQHTPRVLGACGDRTIETPNLDALAGESCRFDACYCNAPLCVPSRASFMTGRFPFKCEVLGNQGGVLDSRIPTLAHMAVRGGYHAVLSGKMHFSGPDQRHGFLERLVGEVSCEALYNGTGGRGSELGDLGNCSKPDPLFHVGAGGNPFVDFDAAVTDSVVEWLGRYAAATVAQKPPFFLVAGFLLPHCPFIAPPEVFDRYRDKVKAPRLSSGEIADLHPFHHAYRKVIDIDRVPEANLDAAAAAYYAMVDILDRNVGRVLQALKAQGLWDDTIVVYFSDHGEMLGQHGRWHKEAFYEDAARVPLLVRHPSRRPAAASACPCSLVDLMPTLCEWVGVRPPPGLDGASLVSEMEGRPGPQREAKVETYTWWPTDYGGLTSNRMIRSGLWKLSYYSAFDSYELFNLDHDPGETRNLAADPSCAAVRAQLAPRLFADGWSAHTAREWEQRMHDLGFAQNIKEFRDTLRNDPLPIDCPDYWRPVEQSRIWLRGG